MNYYDPTGLYAQVSVNQNSKHGDVRTLQSWLNALKVRDKNGNALVVDGSFGPLTQSAVKSFQSMYRDNAGNKLVPDGIVGPLTWGALEREVNKIGGSSASSAGSSHSSSGSSGSSSLSASTSAGSASSASSGVRDKSSDIEKKVETKDEFHKQIAIETVPMISSSFAGRLSIYASINHAWIVYRSYSEGIIFSACLSMISLSISRRNISSLFSRKKNLR